MKATWWRRALVTSHRWLGIGGGLLFLAWFASGIVMIYQRMPAFDSRERMGRLSPLDAAGVTASPTEAARTADASVASARLGMHLGRPVYRFGTAAVRADSGDPLAALDARDAVAVVHAAWPEHAATATHDGHLSEPDQWTLQSRAYLPLHRVALGDALRGALARRFPHRHGSTRDS
jgi:hypothetical protein